ncbi:MAG: hypothetical protein LBN94_00040, partial [Puniceicoccales bacterium]|nr:hypothetical protein [Puniceicoccales bacterium]
MKTPFINHQLILSLGGCSLFVAFLALFGTLYFRQEAFIHGENLKKIETQCSLLQNESLSLSAKIAQMQAPHYLQQKLLAFPVARGHIFYVQSW